MPRDILNKQLGQNTFNKVKELPAKPSDLSLNPVTHMMERDQTLKSCPLTFTYASHNVSKYINGYTGIILVLKATERLHFFFRSPLNCYMLFLLWSSSPLLACAIL